MPHIDNHSKPYQNEVFRYISGGFILMLIIVNFVVYYAELSVVNANAKESLINIAENVANKISASEHEKILTNDQQQSAEYKDIELYFREVMDGNPLIDDIYTLRPTDDPNIMTFVVAGKKTGDLDGDNFIDDSELRPEVGEEYDVTDFQDMKNGLIGPSVDKDITADKWGQWLSGYAPIQNEKGEVVALLGVDVAASDIIADRRSIGMPLLYMDAALLPLLLLLSYFVARALSKPFRTLAIGMQRVSHGELDYRLPLSGNKIEVMFEKLFNNMLGMYDNEINHLKRKKDEDISN